MTCSLIGTEPPSQMFGKLMSISDELMWRYWELLTDKTLTLDVPNDGAVFLSEAVERRFGRQHMLRRDEAIALLVDADEDLAAVRRGLKKLKELYEILENATDRCEGVANIIELTDAQLALTNAQATVAQALKIRLPSGS